MQIAKLLFLHFLRRFFGEGNMLFATAASPYAGVIRTLTMLLLPGFLLSMFLFPVYVELEFRPHLFEPMRWNNKLLFCTMSASIMAFVTALQWDSLFPDREDFMILSPLPLRRRLIFFCKLTALIAFASLFAAAINIGPAIVFPLASLSPATPFGQLVPYIWNHAVSLFLCSAFVFSCCLAVQGALLNLLPHLWYRAVVVWIQFLIMAASATLLLLFPLAAKNAALGQNAPLLHWFVPAWFAGLSEQWNGRPGPIFAFLELRAIQGVELSIGLALLFYTAAYVRYLQTIIETPHDDGAQSALSRWLAARIDRFLLPVQHERGVFHFIWKTLLRSPSHRLYLAGYAGVACALVIWELVTLFSIHSYAVLREPSPALLCIPSVISFLTLCSMRFVFPRPVELRANWIFQLAENDLGIRSMQAPLKVMILIGVLPAPVLLLPVHWYLWGPAVALLHTLYAIALAWLLAEALLIGFRKIPFTCSFVPGGHNSIGWLMLAAIGFGLYAYAMASVEAWMLRDIPLHAPFLFAAIGLLWLLARRLRATFLDGESSLEYDESIEPAVRTLNLSS
ncbi:MAG: hypothetical protein JST65_08270 [Acidobacteria bacterium]|nr:hypothetical protein [Acidobacteriota bacterium]